MTAHHDDSGTLVATDTFTHECPDCTRLVRVVGGVERWHLCPVLPWLRGRVNEAWADGFEWAAAK